MYLSTVLDDFSRYIMAWNLPVTLTVTVALDKPARRLLTVASAGQVAHLHLHQPLGGKRDHVPLNIRVRVFSTSQRRCIIGSVIVVPFVSTTLAEM